MAPASRSRGVAGLAALLAGAALAALWVGTSYAFDLVFHLQPALVGTGTGWVYRAILGRRGTGTEALALTAGTAALVAGGAALIAAGGRGLDAGWVVAVVSGAGLAFGLRLLTRT